MYSSNNASTFRDPAWSGQSTVRRYCIEPTSSVRQVQSDPFIQENSDVLKFYVVSRCNYSSYDRAFLIPQSYLPETEAILNSERRPGNELFDEGVSSSEDDLFGASNDGPGDLSPGLSPEPFGDAPSDGSRGRMNGQDEHYDDPPSTFTTHYGHADSPSSLRSEHSWLHSHNHPAHSFMEAKGASPKRPARALVDEKKRKRDTQLAIRTGKLSQTPFREAFKNVTGRNERSAHEVATLKKSQHPNTNRPPAKEVLVEYREDPFDMDDGGIDYDDGMDDDHDAHSGDHNDDYSLDHSFDHHSIKMTPPRHLRKSVPRAKIKDSSALLNTWYLSRESYSNFDINWKHLKEYSGTQQNGRYPKRTRLPPVCHWDSSNLSASAVRIYKTEGADEPMPESSPNVSLLIEEKGELVMHIAKEVKKPKRTLAALPLENEKLPEDKRALENEKSLGRKPLENGKSLENKKRVRRRNRMERSYLSVDEALDILNNAPDDPPAAKRKAIERRQTGGALPSRKVVATPHVPADYGDSVAEYEGKLISYKSVYRPDDVEAQVHDGNTFKLMIMAQFRTSTIVIPSGNSVNFGNVNSNLIFGHVFSGENVKIRGLEYYNIIDEKDFFYLPMYQEWSIENNSKTRDAVMFLSFVNV